MDEEKGIFEELVEGLVSNWEMKKIIESSRDENGNVDVGKATGIAMGSGHTSADDIAVMAGMLGAEGAFDEADAPAGAYSDPDADDYDDEDPDADDYDGKDGPSSAASREQFLKEYYIYQNKRNWIIDEKRRTKKMIVAMIVIFTVFSLYMQSLYSELAIVRMALMFVVDAAFAVGLYRTDQAEKQELADLDEAYRLSHQKAKNENGSD